MVELGASIKLELGVKNGKPTLEYVEFKLFEPDLLIEEYRNDDGTLNKHGAQALTQCFIQALNGHIHGSHEIGLWDSAEHIRYVLDELSSKFISTGFHVEHPDKPATTQSNVFTDGVHLVAETIPELHKFAKEIGLKHHFYHGKRKRHPHYDLTNEEIRKKAYDHGAIPMSARSIVKCFQRGNFER